MLLSVQFTPEKRQHCGEPARWEKLPSTCSPWPKRQSGVYGYGYGYSAKRGPLPFLTQRPAGRRRARPPPPLPRPLARRSSLRVHADCSE